MALYARLLGLPRVRTGDVWHELDASLPVLLLTYLVGRGEWVSRSELAFLFWPDSADARAASSLRSLLSRARREPGGAGLEVRPDRARWAGDSDLACFRAAIAIGDWAVALSYYDSGLLDGLLPRGYPEFANWLQVQREELQGQWREAVLARARDLLRDGDQAGAAGVMARLARIDADGDEAMATFLRAAEASGQTAVALSLYELYRRAIPGAKRGAADGEAAAIAARLAPTRSPGAAALRTALPLPAAGHLPEYRDAFLGRDAELESLEATLSEPGCRLLSLLGPGGAGKTRLAIEVARRSAPRFRDGATFVALAALRANEEILTAIGEALRLPADPRGGLTAVVRALRGRELLLQLDNCEHLPGLAQLVLAILEGAPAVKILATSRSALGVQREWPVQLAGLDQSMSTAGDLPDAVRFFEERARRGTAEFTLDPTVLPAARRVCALLDGLPLGILLAASWWPEKTVPAIANELERNLTGLEARYSDGEPRHRSLRAVFESSWRLLGPVDRGGLPRLAVFRGDFDEAACRAVAGDLAARLPELAARSLVLTRDSGRYGIHGTLEAFLAEQLAADPTVDNDARERHAAHYATLASDWQRRLDGPEHAAAVKVLLGELPNLRAAWDWALARRRWTLLELLLAGLAKCYELRGQLATAAADARAALAAIGKSPDEAAAALRGRLLTREGVALFRLGRYPEARKVLEEAVAALRKGPPGRDLTVALNNLGNLASADGNLPKARAYYEQSLAGARGREDGWSVSRSLNNLGALALTEGDYETAERYFFESLTLFERQGDRASVADTVNNLASIFHRRGHYDRALNWFSRARDVYEALGDRRSMGLVLNNLGSAHAHLGQVEQSRQLHLASLEVRRAIGDRRGEGVVLMNLGSLALRRGEARQAEREFQESAAVFAEVGYRLGLAQARVGLGAALAEQGRSGPARDQLLSGLTIARELKAAPVSLQALGALGTIELTRGDERLGLRLLQLARLHPAANQETKDRASTQLAGRRVPVTGRWPDPNVVLTELCDLVLGRALGGEERREVVPPAPDQRP
jgi:predicted ATPase/DNA-binding SARP family transcriptional activator